MAALEAGAEDFETEDDSYEITTTVKVEDEKNVKYLERLI